MCRIHVKEGMHVKEIILSQKDFRDDQQQAQKVAVDQQIDRERTTAI